MEYNTPKIKFSQIPQISVTKCHSYVRLLCSDTNVLLISWKLYVPKNSIERKYQTHKSCLLLSLSNCTTISLRNFQILSCRPHPANTLIYFNTTLNQDETSEVGKGMLISIMIPYND